MRTDSIFYVLFETLPSAFFELLGESAAAAEGYKFTSEKLRRRLSGLMASFSPAEDAPDKPIYLRCRFSQKRMFTRAVLAIF